MNTTGPRWMVVYRKPLMSGHYVLWCSSTEVHEHAARQRNPSTGEIELVFGACPNGTHHPRTVAEPERVAGIAANAPVRWNPLPEGFELPRASRVVTTESCAEECVSGVKGRPFGSPSGRPNGSGGARRLRGVGRGAREDEVGTAKRIADRLVAVHLDTSLELPRGGRRLGGGLR